MQPEILSRTICCTNHLSTGIDSEKMAIVNNELFLVLNQIYNIEKLGTPPSPFSAKSKSSSLEFFTNTQTFLSVQSSDSIFLINKSLQNVLKSGHAPLEFLDESLVAETLLFGRDGQLHEQLSIGIRWPASSWKEQLLPLLNTESITVYENPVMVNWHDSTWWKMKLTGEIVVRETCFLCGDEQIHPIPTVSWDPISPQHLVNWQELPGKWPSLLRVNLRQFHAIRFLAEYPFLVHHQTLSEHPTHQPDVYWFNPQSWNNPDLAARAITGLIRGSYSWKRLKEVRGFSLNEREFVQDIMDDGELAGWFRQKLRQVEADPSKATSVQTIAALLFR